VGQLYFTNRVPVEYLKDSVTRFVCFRFFSRIIFPQAPENNVRLISIFFENSRRYSQVEGAIPVSTTPTVNFAIGTAGVVDTGGKFCKMPLGAFFPNPKGGKIYAKKSYHSMVPLKGQ
jgi:hypothetical protein